MEEPFLLGKFISDDVIGDSDQDLELEFAKDDSGPKPVEARQIVVDASYVTSDADIVSQIPTEESILGLPDSNITGRTDFGERGLWLVNYTNFFLQQYTIIAQLFQAYLLLYNIATIY
jgi:hypothetical protein